MTEKLHEFVEKLKAENASWVVDVNDAHGEVTVVVPRENIREVATFLRNT